MKLRRKLLIVLCPVSIVSLVGLGFSTWAVATTMTSNTMNVTLTTGDVDTDVSYLDVFGNITLTSFKMSEHGFEMSDGTYSEIGSLSNPSGGYISGSSSININLAKNAINSLSTNNKMLIRTRLKGVSSSNEDLSLSGILDVGSESISSNGNLSYISSSHTSGSIIEINYLVSISDITSTNTTFNFMFSLNPNSYSSFYSLFKKSSGNGFKIYLSAGEAL